MGGAGLFSECYQALLVHLQQQLHRVHLALVLLVAYLRASGVGNGEEGGERRE